MFDSISSIDTQIYGNIKLIANHFVLYSGFVTKIQIILAKVPILKFNDRISGIEVTLNVNKLVSIRNTLLIHDYTKCKS